MESSRVAFGKVQKQINVCSEANAPIGMPPNIIGFERAGSTDKLDWLVWTGGIPNDTSPTREKHILQAKGTTEQRGMTFESFRILRARPQKRSKTPQNIPNYPHSTPIFSLRLKTDDTSHEPSEKHVFFCVQAFPVPAQIYPPKYNSKFKHTQNYAPAALRLFFLCSSMMVK